MKEPILQLDHVTKTFPLEKKSLFNRHPQVLKAVDDVNLSVYKGQTLGIVGESGSGKSTLGRSILRLYPDVEGDIVFAGESILDYTPAKIRDYRSHVQMIFQDPYSSLNPRMKAGEIIAEPLINLGRRENIRDKVLKTMEVCGLQPHHYDRYPHEFSGGQRQRIGIARALIVEPEIIIADEPTSALDVSIQAQIINLLEKLQDEMQLTYIFISHDLSVVEHISDEVAVMYLGQIVEVAPREELYKNPRHPYTKKLLDAIPVDHPSKRKKTSHTMGDVPKIHPAGCSYHTRCPHPGETCPSDQPKLRKIGKTYVACHSVKEEIE